MQKVLESFLFCPPAASPAEVAAVEMAVANDLELEIGRSAAEATQTFDLCT